MWRLVAGLAVQAAGEAAETVDVGPPGVVGYPPGLGVERVLLVDVVVLAVPGGRCGGWGGGGAGRREEEEESTLCSGESRAQRNTAPDDVLTCCPSASRGGRRCTA